MPSRKYTTLPFEEYPVAEGNYDESRMPIDLIVLHHTATTYRGAIEWFGNPRAGTSAHYIVSNKGEIAAMLEEYYTAYHSGNYGTNQRSVGIETEWYEGMGDRTTELYETVSKLVADIAKFYSIPLDSDHVKPHKAYFNTACPGTLDIPRIIDRARAINNKETDLQACLRMHTELVTKNEAYAREIAKVKAELQSTIDNKTREISNLNTTLLAKDQEIKNRIEQVDRITKSYDEKVEGLELKIKALTSLIDETGAGIATYQDRIKTLEKQFDNEAKEKGKALNRVAELEAKNAQLMKQISGGSQIDYKNLTLKERLKVCIDIIFA